MQHIQLGDIEKHFWLARSVARRMGVSLTEAMADGRLSHQAYAEIVTRCRAADCSEGCVLWLAEQQDEMTPEPPCCAIADALRRLR